VAPANHALLLRAITHLTGTYPGFLDPRADLDAPMPELLSIALDPNRPGSINHSLQALMQAVDQVKDFMSADTQRILNDLRDEMSDLPEHLQPDYSAAPEEALDRLVSLLLALAGLAQESMVRGQGWHFLDMGRRIERGLLSLSLLRSLLVPRSEPYLEPLLLETALISMETLMTYRRRYQRNFNIGDTLDLLLLESANPRSLLFQLQKLEMHLSSLPDSVSRDRPGEEQRLCLEALSLLQLADLTKLAATAEGEFLRKDLDQLLSRSQLLLARIATTLTDRYFDHSLGQHPMRPDDNGSPDNPGGQNQNQTQGQGQRQSQGGSDNEP